MSLVSPGSPITTTTGAQAASHAAHMAALPGGGGVIPLSSLALAGNPPPQGQGVPVVAIHPQMASVITSSRTQAAAVQASLSNGHVTSSAGGGFSHQAKDISSAAGGGGGEKNGIDMKVEGKNLPHVFRSEEATSSCRFFTLHALFDIGFPSGLDFMGTYKVNDNGFILSVLKCAGMIVYL